MLGMTILLISAILSSIGGMLAIISLVLNGSLMSYAFLCILLVITTGLNIIAMIALIYILFDLYYNMNKDSK